MKKIAFFYKKPIALLVATLICFGELSFAYILGAMVDYGLESMPLWWLVAIGLLVFAFANCFQCIFISETKEGYKFSKLAVSPTFLYFYSLLLACVLAFAIFGALSLLNKESFLELSGFNGIMFSVLVMAINGFAFLSAKASRGGEK